MQGQAADAPLSVGIKVEDIKLCSKTLQKNIDKSTRKRSHHRREKETNKKHDLREDTFKSYVI